MLKSDVQLTREQAESLQDKLDQRANTESLLLDKVDLTEQKIRALKNDVNEKAQMENVLLQQVRDARTPLSPLVPWVQTIGRVCVKPCAVFASASVIASRNPRTI